MLHGFLSFIIFYILTTMKLGFKRIVDIMTAVMGFVYILLGVLLFFTNPIPQLLNEQSSKIFGFFAVGYGFFRSWRSIYKKN